MPMLLEIAEKDQVFESVGAALGYALPKALFGFCCVFCVLALIWGILILFKVFFYTIPNLSKNKLSKKQQKNTQQQAETQQTPVEASAPAAIDGNEIVAAIMAAISAYRNASGEGNGAFRVVSFKKRK